MMKRSSLTLFLLLSLFVNSYGQTPQTTTKTQPEQDDVVRITTNLVQVDAVVTDKKGQLVTDLKAEDFEITEDGRKQEITNLSFVSNGAVARNTQPASPVDKNAPPAPPAPPVKLRPEQVQRTMALVVDDLGLSFESIVYVRRALKKFVDEQMQPGDLVAIIRTAGGIGVLQQFTTDKQQLYAAIERVRWNPRGRGGVSAFAPLGSETSTGSDDDNDEKDTLGSRTQSGDINNFRSEIFAVGTLGAVNYVVRGLRELPGRKSVLLISDGFRLLDPNNMSNRLFEAIQRLTDLANRASVVIYTMDARGLVTTNMTAADSSLSPQVTGSSTPNAKTEVPYNQSTEVATERVNELNDTQAGLIYLSQQTGGFAVYNTNDLSTGIRRVLQDQSSYYLIGYRPDESTFDPKTGQRRFHKISIRVKRPGLQVRSRRGFYGISDENAQPVRRTREQQLVGALVSPFNSNAIDLRLTSLFGNEQRIGSYMRSLLYIDAKDLKFAEEADGWHKAVMDVLALTFGDNGQIVDQVNRQQTIRVRGETFKRVLKNGLVYFLNVPIKKAGAYQLRIAVRDATTENVGSASQFIEVPDLGKKRLILSGIVVNGYEPKAGQSIGNGSAQSNAAKSSEGTQEELDPQAGAAVRRFRHGMVMNYGYVIYNAQIDRAARRPQLETQIRVFRDGKLVFTGKSTPVDLSGMTDPARIAAGGAIRLGNDMPPGDYVLQIVVTDLANKDPKRRVTTQWIDFEIVQ